MRVVALVCGLGLMAGVAVAQQDAPPPPAPGAAMQGPNHRGWGSEHRVERMKHELNLTDDQTAQVKAIFEDSRTKMEALRGNTSLSQQDRHAQMKAIHETENGKIEAVLTPDQKSKYEAMQAQMHDRMQDRREGGDAEAPPPPPPPPQN